MDHDVGWGFFWDGCIHVSYGLLGDLPHHERSRFG
jgi:hypothetical protein